MSGQTDSSESDGKMPVRRRYQPSERNLQVYEAVRVQGQVQAAVAARLGLSQRRVSQICQQVDRWRASFQTREPAEAQAIERQFARQQLDEVYQRALKELDRSQKFVERRQGQRGGKSWSVETVRDQPATGQWLRLALQAAERLSDVDSRDQEAATKKLLTELASLLARNSSETSSRSTGPVAD